MLGRFKQTIDKGVATVSVKSNEFIEITKLKTQNTALEKEIDSMKQQLGAAYFSQWKADRLETDSLGELCAEIKAKEDLIADNLEMIDTLQRKNEEILGAKPEEGEIVCACGKPNSPTAKFCINCGSKLESESKANGTDAVEMKACVCGNMVRKTAKFCSKCGHKFSEEETPVSAEEDLSEHTED